MTLALNESRENALVDAGLHSGFPGHGRSAGGTSVRVGMVQWAMTEPLQPGKAGIQAAKDTTNGARHATPGNTPDDEPGSAAGSSATGPTTAFSLALHGPALASLVRHEMRGPLNALSGWLHMLALRPPVASDIAQRAQAGARRAILQQVSQIDSLGAVIAMQMSAQPPLRAPVELGVILQDCALRLGRDAEETDDELACHIDATGAEGVIIEADRTGLVQALVALIRHVADGAGRGNWLTVGRSRSAEAPLPGEAVALHLELEGSTPGAALAWQQLAGSGPLQSLALLHARMVILTHGGHFSLPDPSVSILEICLPVLPSGVSTPAPTPDQGGQP